MLNRIGEIIECLFDKHKFVRRSVLFTILGLIAYITVWGIQTWTDSMFATLCALFAEASLLYQWDKKLQRDHEYRMKELENK